MALPQVSNNYLLEGMVWCLRCGCQMQPASRMDGSRYYSCGSTCEQPDQPAIQLEQDLLLRALVRAHQALFGVGRQVADHSQVDATRLNSPLTVSTPRQPGQLVVARDELRRWQFCDITDRRAVLLTAFTRAVINIEGVVQPAWRHEQEAIAHRELAQATPW